MSLLSLPHPSLDGMNRPCRNGKQISAGSGSPAERVNNRTSTAVPWVVSPVRIGLLIFGPSRVLYARTAGVGCSPTFLHPTIAMH